ncbi:MAG: Penicillin-binding protein 2 [Deltaproteobacteria bacterium]|nr:Penicillin-binding protein 2 [Deltaproteobacteria bacterium]
MAVSTGINRHDGAPKVRDRARWLHVLVVLAFMALIARLAFLQIFQGERYTFLSENNRIRLKRIPGTRGMIFYRQG